MTNIRSIVLGALAALVAIGGVYLLIEVKKSGAAPPSDVAVAQAAARPERGSSSDTDSTGRAPRIEDLNAGGFTRGGDKAKAPSPTEVDRRLAEKLRRDSTPGTEVEDPALNPDLDAAMLQANKLYDRHSYDDARQLALKLLDRQPGTVRMLRVVVSSSCILGDAEMAQKYWLQLPDFDRGQMSTRCERFGVTFTP
ncbi:MAG: hypothetical protein F9K40_04545 [Kofleriaceae bacterium]|nr:MAG: hypothetical protein F9K40_04545 [Kofleriaceae bacterium]MBZ0236901.1 hypothetical protein [Kofleriaceae bacterium]